ncbi:UDP-N-acetylmuramoyl-L-alanyl-D-glutamate--2,6-diaminopimelate ligase [Paenibacillus shenyangensis]|uniref:UDP-N-acetylmuramoyl-L-alanyl-D-glutamate--2, 6-diaminopimelate ligase n=1 Tax=Paenibacillus sp. A9 TaxID=1284352 RepID=UPI0003689B35|nr:UDP-N-acetylmuramoyl-L-alanyl-D-glutamate--2,6-diaminopimelate ligase [Paenibacillus sp. A9]
MLLSEAASLLITSRIEGTADVSITGMEIDSRKVKAGDLFICLPGFTVDGHDFAEQAITQGAAALAVERILPLDIPQLVVSSCRHAMAVLGDAFYEHPSRKLNMIGITGTNGKTTTSYLIERIMNDHRINTGLIGTIEMRYNGKAVPMPRTTPEAMELQRLLHEMVQNDVQCCVMEVSSHALEQGRVKGTDYRTAIFTNISQDHLDYHETMEQYVAAKGLFFARLGNSYDKDPAERKYAVLNADDPAVDYFRGITAADVITYGVDQPADVQASNIRITARGTTFHLQTFRGNTDMTLQMVGKFNVYNALAAITAALIENVPLEQIRESLGQMPGVDGRVEAVDAGQPFAVIVDYAHTPDGLENVLRTISEFAEGRILTVFGCGGDRDRTKRPLMGQVAAKYSDYTLVTSDNPRTEEPVSILDDIEAGLLEQQVAADRYELIVDRRAAIQKAVEMAQPGDVLLIAGKGHETYQIVGTEVHDFDDRLVAKEAIRGLSK